MMRVANLAKTPFYLRGKKASKPIKAIWANPTRYLDAIERAESLLRFWESNPESLSPQLLAILYWTGDDIKSTVEPASNDIFLYDTSSITSDILWHQLIPVNHNIILLGYKDIRL
jgi:hypothetical protein